MPRLHALDALGTIPPLPAIPPRRVLILDDHPPIRAWVRATLAPHQIEVIPARSGEEALEIVAQEAPIAAAICDVLMPHAAIEGIAAARMLWYDHGIPCLILTSVQEAGTRLAAIYAGAFGYVLKDMAEADVLVRSVLTLLTGQRPQDPLAVLNISPHEAQQLAEIRAAHMRALEHLTPQQRVVAGLILEGKTNHEIATQLVLSRGTVNSHVSNILQRLNTMDPFVKTQNVAVFRAGAFFHPPKALTLSSRDDSTPRRSNRSGIPVSAACFHSRSTVGATPCSVASWLMDLVSFSNSRTTWALNADV